jgi:Mg/Co/Ni transporter MgtE
MDTDHILIERFMKDHPAEAARILEDLNIPDVVSFIGEIPTDLAVKIFRHLERYSAVRCLEELDVERSATIVEKVPPEIAVVFFRRIRKELREPILNGMSKDISSILRGMLRYPEDTAGALVNPLSFSLPEDITVAEAMKRVKKGAEKTSYYLYVVKRDQTLSGVINMRELMLADPEEHLASVMHADVVRLSAEANLRAILDHPGWASCHALPVVDHDGVFMGAIRYTVLRRIEVDDQGGRVSKQALAASNALGELYRIGLTGLLRSASEAAMHRKEN